MPIIFLLFLFGALALIVGHWKGLRAVLSLGVSVLIIVKIFVPLMLRGIDPIIAALLASAPIIVLIVYITEGFNKRAHLALLAIAATSLIVLPLTWIVMRASQLTGLNSEEVYYVADLLDPFKLAFAGVMLGTVAILCEMVITQVSAVEQLYDANPLLPFSECYTQASVIGRSHMSAVINTLFLIYVSTALPVVLLVVENKFAIGTILNNEPIMLEIIRTLAGAIAVVLSIPISTALGAWYLRNQTKKNKSVAQ